MTSQERIVQLLFRLLDGESINFRAEARDYGCSERTMTRDQAVIADALVHETEFEMGYKANTHQHYLDREDQISQAEALALIKLVIGTRALSRAEMQRVTHHLLNMLSLKTQKAVKKTIATTMAAYIPVGADQKILPRLAKFSDYIIDKQAIKFSYQSSVPQGNHPQFQVGRPLSLYFADYYFYVVMYLEDNNRSVVFRLDRFDKVKSLNRQLEVPADKKTDEGALRQKTYLLNGGYELHYRFRYWGYPQTALDKLPKSQVTHRHDDGSVTIEGDLFSQGALLWVLGQGALIKVLAPQTLINDVKATLQKTLAYYD
ncbi:transcriptional regulator [Levilactobacillus zymae]|uniref:Transcriptional regulator n=1 Tax=Levilactobacillus zymae TaxID=267363 RepID=A0ABQ0WZQ9_9LACO|nr:WYL domain-containing protein [Levilactobacillus zymae]KRL06927.1 hypothetical protein FD38_GL000383 [Levilactobacillus zymae DSM 19395]QFR62213.1 WYL domain-containing protein [Levilactobacillus zymae]GEO73123.1 transcriptional regulator [Levilactobacillus zymae]